MEVLKSDGWCTSPHCCLGWNGIRYSNCIGMGSPKLKKWKNLHIGLMSIYWNVLKVWNYVIWILQLWFKCTARKSHTTRLVQRLFHCVKNIYKTVLQTSLYRTSLRISKLKVFCKHKASASSQCLYCPVTNTFCGSVPGSLQGTSGF